jgi:MYXO-CTERM domain-containing protein
MVPRTIRASTLAFVLHLLISVPASAATIQWNYQGTVSSNFSGFGGIADGAPVTMTVLLDTGVADAYTSAMGPDLEPCGLYSVPQIAVSFAGFVYTSSGSTMTVNTPAGAGSCGYGPSNAGYVLVGNATGPSPGPLAWRIYAEIGAVPAGDGIPLAPPLGSGVFLELAYGFAPPSFADFAMTAQLTSTGNPGATVSSPATAIPEPGLLALAAVGLAAVRLRRRLR